MSFAFTWRCFRTEKVFFGFIFVGYATFYPALGVSYAPMLTMRANANTSATSTGSTMSTMTARQNLCFAHQSPRKAIFTGGLTIWVSNAFTNFFKNAWFIGSVMRRRPRDAKDSTGSGSGLVGEAGGVLMYHSSATSVLPPNRACRISISSVKFSCVTLIFANSTSFL